MRDTCEPTPIKDYECVSRENNQTNSDTNAAGGVAIYRKLSSTSTAEVVQIAITDATRVIKTKGDMCMTEVTCFTANTSFKFILGAVYIHPGASMQDIGMLLWQGLSPYVHNSQYVPPFVQVDSSIPILLCEKRASKEVTYLTSAKGNKSVTLSTLPEGCDQNCAVAYCEIEVRVDNCSSCAVSLERRHGTDRWETRKATHAMAAAEGSTFGGSCWE
ncbi:hypothetical protein J6590_086470 [Homalodisca vitripennis]|nr:hypothetical protein J6590_086470 [Homalodisca vitripennis]